jgi:hypothetical protein
LEAGHFWNSLPSELTLDRSSLATLQLDLKLTTQQSIPSLTAVAGPQLLFVIFL